MARPFSSLKTIYLGLEDKLGIGLDRDVLIKVLVESNPILLLWYYKKKIILFNKEVLDLLLKDEADNTRVTPYTTQEYDINDNYIPW